MCQRMCPLTFEEAQLALEERERTGHARVEQEQGCDTARDAYPGSEVAAFSPNRDGKLTVVRLTWGFEVAGLRRPVFNTRIETALSHLRSGEGTWARAILEGRCLVPVRAFYESSATERVPSERTGKPVRRQYRFRLPGARAFLLAGVQQDGRLSIVTTEPNAAVSPIHNRMPLVLGAGESSIWLSPDFASLADRSLLPLVSEPER